MRAVVQRVSRCAVRVDGATVSSIGPGLLVYLGVGVEDAEQDVEYMADKVVHLRVFPDDGGRMNRSALQLGAEIMVVSQFTLQGDARRGRRPSYTAAAPPELARRLYLLFVERLRSREIAVGTGTFQALMEVDYVNDGPVTILLDSRRLF